MGYSHRDDLQNTGLFYRALLENYRSLMQNSSIKKTHILRSVSMGVPHVVPMVYVAL